MSDLDTLSDAQTIDEQLATHLLTLLVTDLRTRLAEAERQLLAVRRSASERNGAPSVEPTMTDEEIQALDGYDFRKFADTVSHKEEIEEGDTPIRSFFVAVEYCGSHRGDHSLVTICRGGKEWEFGEFFYTLIDYKNSDADPWCAMPVGKRH